PPNDPLQPTSTINVDTPRHAAVASEIAPATSAAGEPGPAGSFISVAPHDAQSSARTSTNAPARGSWLDEPVLGGRLILRLSSFVGLLLFGADLLVDVGFVDRVAVSRERARPGR